MTNAAVSFTLKAIDETQAAFRSVEAGLGRMQTVAEGLNTMLAGVLGVGAVAGLVGWARSAIAAADALNTLNERTGISVQELSGVTYAFEQAGAGAEDAEMAIKRMAQAIGEAGRGDRGKQDLFRALGMEEAARGAQSATDALKALADVFPRLDESQRAVVGAELLGRGWERTAGLLNKGREEVQRLVEEGQRLRPITDELAKQADELGDSWSRLKIAAQSAAIPALEAMLPAVNNVTNAMLEARKAGAGLIDTLRFGLTRGLNNALGTSATKELEEVEKRIAEIQKQRAAPGSMFGGGLFGGLLGKRQTDLEDYARTLRGIVAAEKEAAEAPLTAQINAMRRQPGITLPSADATPALKRVRAGQDALAREAENLRDADLKGWVAHAEKVFELAAEESRALEKIYDERAQLAERAAKQAAEDWVKAIDNQIDEQRRLADLVPSMAEKMQEAEAAGRQAAKDIGLVFTSSAQEAMRNWQGVANLLRSIGQDVLALVYKRAVAEPMGNAVSSAIGSSGVGKAMDSFWSWLVSAIPGRAIGGPVAMGKPYLVGERGPELFIPSASGIIAPGGAGGTYYIDARGADREGLARLEAMIASLHGSIETRAVAAVADAKLRGGAMANLFR